MNKQTVIKQIICLFVFLSSLTVYAADKVVVISPHRKSIQREFIPMFEAFYKKKFNKKVTVEWLDQGGTSDDLRFVKAKFVSSSIGSLIRNHVKTRSGFHLLQAQFFNYFSVPQIWSLSP